jgi:D-lyxose ketol-isomerase
MATPVIGLNTQTSPTPGTSIAAIDVNQAGGYIVNPIDAVDQGLASPEPLYVNQVTSAALQANGTTIALQPGQSYTIIPNTSTPVTVSSASANHKFTAVMWPTA